MSVRLSPHSWSSRSSWIWALFPSAAFATRIPLQLAQPAKTPLSTRSLRTTKPCQRKPGYKLPLSATIRSGTSCATALNKPALSAPPSQRIASAIWVSSEPATPRQPDRSVDGEQAWAVALIVGARIKDCQDIHEAGSRLAEEILTVVACVRPCGRTLLDFLAAAWE